MPCHRGVGELHGYGVGDGIASTWISRKRHKFRIPRQTIRPDVILLESLLHIYPPGLVEAYVPIPHDALHVLLGADIEASARVTFHDVATQVKIIRGEAGLDVRHEGGGDAGVEGLRDAGWEEMEPARAGGVEYY